MKTWIAAAVAVIAVFAAVFYAGRPAKDSRAAPAPVRDTAGHPAPAPAAQRTSRAVLEPAARPSAVDPRLAALMVSPENALIEFVVGPEGKVIREIDNDPNSPGFRKPLREYTYAGDQVVAVTAYRYAGGAVQTTRTIVTYRPDGSIDRFLETKN